MEELNGTAVLAADTAELHIQSCKSLNLVGLPNFEANAAALAAGIRKSSVLETITFGDKEAVTMKADMTEVDFSGKGLGASGAMIVAAFLPKCQ